MWRAVTGEGLQDVAYVLIIAWETVAALVLTAGTWCWARRDPGRARQVAKAIEGGMRRVRKSCVRMILALRAGIGPLGGRR